MSLRLGLVLFALAAPVVVCAADPSLPPGASLRLGETRFRAGGAVSELHFSQDGSELTSRIALDETRTRSTQWDVATGESLAATTETRRPGARVRWSATSIPNGTRGILIGDDGVPVIRDFATEKDLARLTGHFARVSAVAVSNDGKRIATASIDGFIRIWDAATFRPLHEAVGHTAAVKSVELAPDGRTLLTTGADRTVRVWDLATGRERRAFAIPEGSHPLFTADAAAIRIPTSQGEVVRDLVTGLEITSPVQRAVESLPILKSSLRHLGIALAVSPDGRTVARGRRDGSIDLFEVAALQVRRTLVGHGGPCLDLAFTPDGTRLISAGADHAVLVWPVRVRDVPLALEVKRETNASTLWDRMAYGSGTESYSAMARLAADPPAAVKMARLCLKPGSAANPIADARAVELLEAIGSVEARVLLRELAEDETDAVRVLESRATLTRLGDVQYSRDGVRTIGGTRP